VAVQVRKHERAPLWRNSTVLKWAAQLIAVAFLVVFIGALATQAGSNIDDRNLTFSTKFLSDPPGFQLGEGIDTTPDTGRRVLYAGLVNTLRVAISGILATTVLGTIIGVARLSSNWIVKRLATVYVETIRNIPLLVQIIFWLAIVQGLHVLTEDDVGSALFISSARGLAIPWVFPGDGFYQWLAILVAGLIVAYIVYRRRMRLKEERGAETYAVSWAIAVFVLFAVVGWFAHPSMVWLGAVWGGLADVIGAIPSWLIQAILAVASVAGAGWWIRRFLASKRSAAGLAKLTDDDWFRIVFAALAGVAFAGLFIVLSGVGSSLVNAGEAFFNLLSSKYDTARTGAPLVGAMPAVELTGAGFVQLSQSSLVLTPGFTALWLGVTLYTASFIAEIVRGGILAVAKGQSEAGAALGLKRSQLLRFVILPQAFRIILPPMGNQYLNLFKNTSLGIAVAYPEIVTAGQTLYNQTGQTIPIVLIWMGFYLAGSLVLSSSVNYYNRRLRLVER
jgi:general L-amino acid transport system permease protein